MLVKKKIRFRLIVCIYIVSTHLLLCSAASLSTYQKVYSLHLKFVSLSFFSLSSFFFISLQKWKVSQTKIRVISTLLFILFGCLLFVALPAVIFKHIEGWSTLESIYFVVITLTTIGFGDFVAGEKGHLILFGISLRISAFIVELFLSQSDSADVYQASYCPHSVLHTMIHVF